MSNTQFSQSNIDNACSTNKTIQVKESNQPLTEIATELTVDDILSRMDRLRTLASMQRSKSRSSKRQQYSFCF
jgi:hypothetical protein